MDRYLLFGTADQYEKAGGMNDFIQSGDCWLKLIEITMKKKYRVMDREEPDFLEWWHIYDARTKTIIACSLIQGHGWGSLHGPFQSPDCQLFTFDYENEIWVQAS